jgi:glycerol-3-phosphate dehydrogenase (NAD(P)+)
MPESITILGDGAMATVCSILLTAGQHRVTMWGAFEANIDQLLQDREQRKLLPGVRVPAPVRLTANDAECFQGATLILNAIPSQYVRSVFERLKDHIPQNTPIVSVAKGIENGTLMRPSQVIHDVLRATNNPQQNARNPQPQSSLQQPTASSGRPERSEGPPASSGRPERSEEPALSLPKGPALCVLSGPNVAGEIARYLPATAVAASEDETLARRVQSTFGTQWYRVYTNDDVVGVELAGAVKNVIAIAAGILDGLAAGNNAKAALVTRGLVEITRLGLAMGAREETFQGLAGVGDLITTCVSPEGRNRTVGEQLGKGRKLQEILANMPSVAEGVETTRAVTELAHRHRVEMPITEAVNAVLFKGRDPIAALTDLMSRDPKPERGQP